VTRVARPIALEPDLLLALLIGPVEGDGLTDEDLDLGWHFHGGRLLEDYVGPYCSRPWGWWRFEACEEMPRAHRNPETGRWEGEGSETVRLAELLNHPVSWSELGRPASSGGM